MQPVTMKIVPAVVVALALTSCSDVVGPTTPAAVDIVPADAELYADGEAVQLEARPVDEAGNAINGLDVTWESRTPNVAAVSTSGLVVARSLGAATIVADVEGVEGSATLTIVKPFEVTAANTVEDVYTQTDGRTRCDYTLTAAAEHGKTSDRAEWVGGTVEWRYMDGSVATADTLSRQEVAAYWDSNEISTDAVQQAYRYTAWTPSEYHLVHTFDYERSDEKVERTTTVVHCTR